MGDRGVGRAAIEGVLSHPDLELVGCWVHSDDKAGRDVSELIAAEQMGDDSVDVERLGVIATTDEAELVALGADCVVYSPLVPDIAQVKRILASGTSVVTPLGWIHPRGEELAELDELCRRSGSVLHGTGIHPGGIAERFPLVLSALSGSITHVRAEEFSDIRTYGAPDVIRDWMLFGATPEAARESVMPAVLGGGFGQSVRMVAEELGFRIDDELTSTHEMAVATALHCVNAVPYVCAAEPGVRTYLDLPPVAGRAAPHLS